MEENTLIPFDNLFAALEEYGQEVRNAYQDELINEGHLASGKLLNSVEFQVFKEGTMYEVQLRLQDYWKWVEQGRKPGKFPPVDKILEWVKVKPVIPRKDKNGKIPSPKQLAYLIGRKIATEGIEPSNTLAKTLETLNQSWLPRIEQACALDLQKWVINTFGDIPYSQ